MGFVTFQRLAEGGNLALGEGESRGYIEVCEGLAVRAYKVTHGKCASAAPNSTLDQARRASIPNLQDASWPTHSHSHNQTHNGSVKAPDIHARRASVLSMHSQPGTPTFYSQQSTAGGVVTEQAACIVDSSAFFIRDEYSGKEVLVFGDVEPDSISLYPRTHIVWAEAALKIAQGHLAAVFIECSYSDSQPDAVLFGHLAPRHLIAELIVLADMVSEKKREIVIGKAGGDQSKAGIKRKRRSLGGGLQSPQPGEDHNLITPGKRSRSRNSAHTLAVRAASPLPEEDGFPDASMAETTPTPGGGGGGDDSARDSALTPSSVQNRDAIATDFESPTRTRFAPEPSPGSRDGPLKGFRVVVIHVKDNMADGPLVGETILEELLDHEEQLAVQGRALGCGFEISQGGSSYWF